MFRGKMVMKKHSNVSGQFVDNCRLVHTYMTYQLFLDALLCKDDQIQ